MPALPRPALPLLLGLLALHLAPAARAQTGALVGHVVEAGTGLPLPGATVRLLGTERGAAADADGRFQIDAVATGAYAVEASFVGYERNVLAEVAVRGGRTTEVRLALAPAALGLGEAVVTAGAAFERPPDTPVSAHALSAGQIERAPGAAGDVLRVVQALPGVTVVDDQRNDLVVRGGSPAENLFLLDGIEVPSLNHFGDPSTSGGPVSMLNAGFVRDADFYAGAFPARYGGRLSSVVAIGLREGSRRRTSADLELGLAGAGGLVEGPLGRGPDGARGAYAVALRRSFLELVADGIGLNPVPVYWNGTAKVTWDAGPADRLRLVAVGGLDALDDRAEPGAPESFDAGGAQGVVGAGWQRLHGARGVSDLTASFALYRRSTDLFDASLVGLADSLGLAAGPGGLHVLRSRDREATGTVRYDGVARFAWGEGRAGAVGRVLAARYEIARPLGSDDAFDAAPGATTAPLAIDRAPTEVEAGAYVEATPRLAPLLGPALGDRADLTLGLRAEHYGALGATTLDPRAALRLRVAPSLDVSAGWGVYRQAPALLFVSAHPSNAGLRPIRAEHVVGGVAWYPRDDVRVSAEAFVKTYRDYPVARETPTLSIANTGDGFDVADLLVPLTSEGTGRVAGFEVFVQKRATGPLYGQVSLAYQRTRHQALDGVRRPGQFDVPVTATALGGVRLGPWSLSAKWAFATGRTLTPFLQPASTDQNRPVLDLSRIGADRGDDYHRLDLRVDRRFDAPTWSASVFVEALNAYGRTNVRGYVWDPDTNGRAAVEQIPFLPSVGVAVRL